VQLDQFPLLARSHLDPDQGGKPWLRRPAVEVCPTRILFSWRGLKFFRQVMPCRWARC